KIFAKLLYGSKFHRLKQQRGQQGIGISAAVMYAQLTTGRPTKIISKTDPKKQAHYMELHLNTQTNNPEIMVDEIKEWKKDHGTRIEMDLEGSYLKGNQSVDEYLIIPFATNIISGIYETFREANILLRNAKNKHSKDISDKFMSE
ncbi:MAG: topoisomerase VI, B subunit protein, partial [Microgenomates group bacterium GW2011_GWC1_41_8]